ncbi:MULTISPECIES: carboxylating nicotinate-nucleotide diphosphorylase [unclassified Beijerinckia]|uniref:carboxylating nicotinate-nucleotide diphosphorylase n=1 Tax=unclassified Beijerinckia TaxID=2638183 RepID=UPI00089CFD10|nr:MULTISPECIES: carboxylating nicotinate-nucleotide diphosphorylase [unclassified Beijerinckia]MDH7796068.1 nicotinate-nucleotide pyrophosphorylase (carboxylating) [Beijerinckia sp. GAS462]SEC28875.1 nicotinate-nucleotide pyrophosphorylase [carboxylating] [Beijerinckia sp. 28-YEA-48]
MTNLFLNPLLIDKVVRAALEEDNGRVGDITSLACIPEGTQARAVLAPRKPGTISGLSVAEAAFKITDPSLTFEYLAKDGDEITVPRTPVARITGDARAILTAERTALNFICHMSGIATMTAKLVALTKHTKAKVICTRKTTPNLRVFQKYAIRCGGGMNHRFGLDDAVLIKDNHIAVCGGIKPALRAAKASVGHMVKIEIEVDNLDQLKEVIEEGADVVLLDNMTPAQMAEGVKMIAGRMKTEASGGISAETAKAVAESGVDMLSLGALTNSAPILDLGLDIEIG